jgi:hypothetical protein
VGERTIVDASGLVLGAEDLETGFQAAVVAGGFGEVDARLQDEELGVRGDVEGFARLELGCWLVVDVDGVLGEGAVSLTDDLLVESGELDGACAVVASCDQPRGLFVHEAVVDDVLDGALAELASGEESAVPALLLLGEVGLAVVVVGQPDVRQESINHGSAVLGSFRGCGQDLSGRGVTLNSPVKHTSHGGLEVDSAVLRLRDIAVDPQHVVIGRSLQRHGVIATFGTDSGEEITGHAFVAVSGLRESEDVCNLKVLQINVSLLPVLQLR